MRIEIRIHLCSINVHSLHSSAIHFHFNCLFPFLYSTSAALCFLIDLSSCTFVIILLPSYCHLHWTLCTVLHGLYPVLFKGCALYTVSNTLYSLLRASPELYMCPTHVLQACARASCFIYRPACIIWCKAESPQYINQTLRISGFALVLSSRVTFLSARLDFVCSITNPCIKKVAIQVLCREQGAPILNSAFVAWVPNEKEASKHHGSIF